MIKIERHQEIRRVITYKNGNIKHSERIEITTYRFLGIPILVINKILDTNLE